MKPVPIPEQLRHADEGFVVRTIGAPPGDEDTIGSVEAEVGISNHGPTFLLLIKLDESDLLNLQENGGLFWYSVIAEHLHPFAFHTLRPTETENVQLTSLESHLFTDSEQNVHTPDDIARAFHETYERLAPEYSYKTREASAVPWEDVPVQNKALMTAVVTELFF